MGNFFAEVANQPALRIASSDQREFRKGLVRLRDWFAALCSNNKSLASMIFTMDDGPFVGGDVDIKSFPQMRLIESDSIPGTPFNFVLMQDRNEKEPMIIGVVSNDKSVKWLRRFSNAPSGRITEAWLKKPAVYGVEGYGYAVYLMTDGSSGVERSYVYLDEGLNLRFYFVSW